LTSLGIVAPPSGTVLGAASELLAAGRYDAVIALLTPLDAAEDSRDVLLATALIGRRRAAPAFALLRRRLAVFPDDPAALYQLGRAHLLDNDAFGAVRAFERVAALAPEFPGLAAALAGAYRRDARYADALARIDRRRPGTIAERCDLLYEQAVCLAHLGRPSAALASFDAVVADDPDHAAAWFGSHAPALDLHGLEDAERRLYRAVACRGANGKYWAFLVAYALLTGRSDVAAELRRDRLDRYPKRQPLADAVAALLPALSPDVQLFGVAGTLLRHALAGAEGEGMVLEFGVRRGNSINQIAEATDQTVHGFDSFTGLPEAWNNEPAGVLTTGAQLPPVRDNVVLHAGWFDDTLLAFLARHSGPVRFVNIDSDIYSSASTVLTALADRLQSGSVLVFDEFIGNKSWRDDEFKAFHEFIAATGRSYAYIAVAPFTKQVAVRLD
jgi:tetratricopeptide (TPR) repeat protein